LSVGIFFSLFSELSVTSIFSTGAIVVVTVTSSIIVVDGMSILVSSDLWLSIFDF
jgi:hypothetical protein